jgi:hypothetical protein
VTVNVAVDAPLGLDGSDSSVDILEDGLVVDHEGAVRVLESGVGGQGGVERRRRGKLRIPTLTSFHSRRRVVPSRGK